MKNNNAVLALADGTLFRGVSVGFESAAVGEAVFNTAMTGYQEILTDPSYSRQIVALTAAHIGNTGANAADCESDRVFAAALVARAVCDIPSNWRAAESLPDFLRRHKTPAVAEIDTRKLTRKLRDGGAQNACVLVAGDDAEAVRRAREFEGIKGAMLAAEASRAGPRGEWTQGDWSEKSGDFDSPPPKRRRVVVLDCGVKRNILRDLARRGCEAVILDYEVGLDAVLAQKPDGVLLSNGPGDPAPCRSAIDLTRALLARKIPLFGICLGHQLLALAIGARTIKMKFGHHGANHPVVGLADGRVWISSQNHGFAVDADSLPAAARPTFRSLFDGTLQGIECDGAFSFQGHPEASPGPREAGGLFDRFVAMMDAAPRRH